MLRTSSAPSRRPYAGWSREALVEALAGNDREAFGEIYERYWQELFRLAYRKLGVREEAEELVQDLFASLWHKRATARIGQLEAYLRQAVKYRVIDAIRAGQVQQQFLTASLRGLAQDRNTEERVAAADLSDALAASVERMPAHTREVFRLSRTEHQSVPEIAERLHLSPKTVEYHLTKALKMLRLELKDFLVLALLWVAER